MCREKDRKVPIFIPMSLNDCSCTTSLSLILRGWKKEKIKGGCCESGFSLLPQNKLLDPGDVEPEGDFPKSPAQVVYCLMVFRQGL